MEQIRVTQAQDRCHRRFIVKNPKKIAFWKMMAAQHPWDKEANWGIRIDRWRE